MILQALHTLHGRLARDPSYEIARPDYSPQKMAFRVVLQSDGTLVEFQDARVPNEKGKLYTPQLSVPGQAKPPGSGINPCFLWDNQTYLLGRQPGDKGEGFGQARFEAFRDRHLALQEELATCAPFQAVCRFLENWSPAQIDEHSILNEVGTGFGYFQIVGTREPVHEDPRIVAFWEKASTREAKNAPVGQCLITGEVGPIARLHPKIKGIKDAQSAGASLVSFNSNVYESYGKEQGFNAPVSETAAAQYGVALNALLTGPKSPRHRLQIAGSTCVYWTDCPNLLEDVFADISAFGSNAGEETQDESLRRKIETILSAISRGQVSAVELGADPETTRFHILGLAPNAARLSVRFYYQSSIRELIEHLRQHQSDLSIVREFEAPVGKRRADPIFPAYWELIRETARAADEVPPLLAGALMRAILQGTPYPESLLTSVIRRSRTDREVPYLKAALIKAVLTRNHHLNLTPMLDPENNDPAYLHGRLFAVLEKIQEEGHLAQTQRRLEKTIRDTYFASASTTPAAIFSRLEKLSTHHSRHLHPGRKVQLQTLIGDIKWLQDQPVDQVFNTRQQGLFILGYYHQRKDLFSKKETPEETLTA